MTMNCIGGTPPSEIAIPVGDGTPTGQQGEPAYTRRLGTMPAGSIGVFGDSILQMMHENRMHKDAEPYALGGQSLRRVINSLNSSLSGFKYGFMQNAGAGVLMAGVNDLGNTEYYGPWTNGQAVGTIGVLFSAKLSPYLTGKWVICHLLPIDEVTCGTSNYNAQITTINSTLHANSGGVFYGCAASLQFIPVDSSWVDGNGNLKDEYHIDGQHPSIAFCRIYEDCISAKLTS